MNNIETLGDTLPKEIERVKEVLADYKSIGPSGLFASTWIEKDLNDAIEANKNQDVIAMLSSFQKLKEINS